MQSIFTRFRPQSFSTRFFTTLGSTNKTLYDFDFTPKLEFEDKVQEMKCYRVLGNDPSKVKMDIPKDKLLRIYEIMVMN